MINISFWGNSSEQAVKEFEQQIGFTLPADYRQFLINNNGAWVNNQKFFVKDLGQEILMHVLYGLTNSESQGLTLGYWLAEHDDDIGEKELVIGHDQGGHQILLVTDGGGKGVYYWDHNNFFHSPPMVEVMPILWPMISPLFARCYTTSKIVSTAHGSIL